MRRLNVKQMEAKVAQDMLAMESWAEKFQADANRQGNLDVKYLADRYQRGVAKLATFAQEKHMYVTLEDSHDKCTADVLKFISSMRGGGSQPNLGSLPMSCLKYIHLSKKRYRHNESTWCIFIYKYI